MPELPKSVQGLRCPACVGGPLTATHMDWADVHACERCSGVWCTARAFIASEIGLSVEFRPDGASGPSCPECRQRTDRLAVVGADKVFVSQCKSCHGFWFERSSWERVRLRRDAHAERRDDARFRQTASDVLLTDAPDLLPDDSK